MNAWLAAVAGAVVSPLLLAGILAVAVRVVRGKMGRSKDAEHADKRTFPFP